VSDIPRHISCVIFAPNLYQFHIRGVAMVRGDLSNLSAVNLKINRPCDCCS
jgi:hypothetical protein